MTLARHCMKGSHKSCECWRTCARDACRGYSSPVDAGKKKSIGSRCYSRRTNKKIAEQSIQIVDAGRKTHIGSRC
jgi:hypothetical protein